MLYIKINISCFRELNIKENILLESKLKFIYFIEYKRFISNFQKN